MNFFRAKTCWSNMEFIPFKLCVASFYIIVGAYFHDVVRHYYIPLFIVFGITVLWTLYLWIGKMKKANGKSGVGDK